MPQNIIWYHEDWTQPSVIKADPHPTDWGIGQWPFGEIAKFMSERNREVKRLATSLRHPEKRIALHTHRDPSNPTLDIHIHTGVSDRTRSGLALVSDSQGALEAVTVITPSRLRRYAPSHIARHVKVASREHRGALYDAIPKLRFRGDIVAFSAPMTSRAHGSRSALHDFERALIRAMAIWLEEVDAADARRRAA
jgi:hypothetical protein